jgi:hypothetical protein
MKRVMSFSIGIVLMLFFVSIIHAQYNPTVYVTRTGLKYHNIGCSSLRKSAIPMKLSEAATKYLPCLRCNPPLPSYDVKSSTSSKSNVSTTPQR